MVTRKGMKTRAKAVLKKHYFMLVAVCLFAAFIGIEFSGSLAVIDNYSEDREIMEETEMEGVASGAVGSHHGLLDVMEAMLQGGEEDGRKLSEQIKKEKIEESKQGNPMLGRSRGVLAQAVNAVTSGGVLVTIVSTLKSILGSADIVVLLLIILGFLLLFSFWFFFKNMYKVISRRIFLEGRCYEKVPIQRFLFLLRVKKWTKVSWTMFVTYLLQILWDLTVVGGIIKHYSYFMVPYITAENPDVKALEAITLSRKMMKGHKRECFVFELSFIGWWILRLFTGGLSGILFSNPYETAAFCEYYQEIRRQAEEAEIPGCQLLNDIYLYEQASDHVIQDAYADVVEIMKKPAEDINRLKGWKGFLANYLGIILTYSKEEQAYEESQAEQIRIAALKGAVERKIYPGRLFPIPEHMMRSRIETINYMRHYSVCSMILLFFAFAFVGWIWEVSIHLVEDGVFVNRGVLHGPWLPIYGAGSVLILLVLNKLRRYPALEFVAAVILCGCVEYFTSYYLEVAHDGKKWWDYSGYFLNLNGRICAEGLLVFGLGGMVIVYIAAPLLDNMIKKVQTKILLPVCIVLLCVFAADQMYSSKHPNTGKGITDYNSVRTENQLDKSCW